MSYLWEGLREGCGSCRFWLAFEERDESVMGTCKRFPPTVLSTKVRANYGNDYYEVQQHLPTMAKKDWCGEWIRNSE